MAKRFFIIFAFFFSLTACAWFSFNLFKTSSDSKQNIEAMYDNYQPQDNIAFFMNETLGVPDYVNENNPPRRVLGVNNENKKIMVDLSQQKLYAYEGDQIVYEFSISSGKTNHTPTGEFRIWSKYRFTKMSGGSKAKKTYYYLPNVPYVMFFANDKVPAGLGYSIHGTYWHNNFGHPMSHGCINMKTSEAEKIYYWAAPDLQGKKSIRASDDNQGTLVVIYGTTPRK